MARSHLEVLFKAQCSAIGLEIEREELRFMEKRKFRFDFAWPSVKIAVEIDGGTFGFNKGHAGAIVFQKDCIKQNFAMELGWRVFRADTVMVKKIDFAQQVKRAINKAKQQGKHYEQGTIPGLQKR